ncbi:MAG: TonB-dependent receptor, partial [Parahaliea sp.]
YYRKNDMALLQNFLAWQPTEEKGHESVGLRTLLRGEHDWLSWIAGAEAEFTDGWLKEVQAEPFSPNQPAGVHYDYQVDARTAAVFAQLSWVLAERWTLDGGLRFEDTRYKYDNRAGDGPACGPEASACRFYRPGDREDSFSDPSFNLGLAFEYRPGQVLFLRGAHGFRSPETAELYRLQAGQRVADLDSEQIVNIELGLRGTALDSHLGYSLSLYQMRKDDVIFQDADRYNVSGAKTLHRGAELSLDYRFARQWYAGLDFTFAKHTYDDDSRLLGVDQSIEGKDIDTAPRRFGSARLGWRGELARAELEWVYLDEYYLEPTNSYRYQGHQLLNLRASTPLGEGLSASVRVTNLLDEKYAERADYGFGQYRYFVGQPRSVYLELDYRFGG